MHPLLSGLLGPWEFRPEVAVPMALLISLYIVGWRRLRRQSKRQKVATRRHLLWYLFGHFWLSVALMSPIDMLGGQLLLMHMVQHKILVMIAAIFLWMGNPFPIVLWSMPTRLRIDVSTALFARDSWFRRALTTVTTPVLCWFIFLFLYIGWHDAALYNAALEHEWVHNVEHLCFFLGAMLFWWPVFGGAPQLHPTLPYWVRIVYVLAIVPPNAIAGVVIATSSQVIYTYYNSVPHIWGFTALEDQMWGGAIMWIWSSEMMINIAVILLAVMFNQEKRRKAAMERMAVLPNRRRMPAAAGEKVMANEAPLMAEQQAVTV